MVLRLLCASAGRGWLDEKIDAVIHENPRRFMEQSPRFKLA
jgi:hypothetical protein